MGRFEPEGSAPVPARSGRDLGIALDTAQLGEIDPSAKPLKGFRGASVVGIRATFRTDAYRVVYTVQFAEVVYVLHAFQKKATRGIATPKTEIDVIKTRLRQAKEIDRILGDGDE